MKRLVVSFLPIIVDVACTCGKGNGSPLPLLFRFESSKM